MVSGKLTGRIRVVLVMALLTVVIVTSGVHERVVATEETYDTLKVFTEVLTLVRHNYVESTDSKELVFGAIRGMLEGLDPHSSFMPPELYKEMQIETQGSFGGLGIEITVRERYLTVVAPIEGTPADRAGIVAGDRIIRIDGAATKDMTLVDAVRKLRGPKGTPVTITILREGQEPFDVTLTRDIIEVHSVRTSDLGEGIGYVRLSSFQERTSRDLQEELKALKDKGMRGLILDLRNNPGGLLTQAVQIADIFLEKGKPIVYTEGRAKSQNLSFVDQHEGPLDTPMVVLVNKGSASASEIVAGALQDHHRAVVVGTQTFGKGTVQTVIPLNDGSGLRLTTAKYFTPNRRAIDGSGLTPDVVVEPPKPPPTTQTEG
ncbi:MAG TPA: S41 family peptidase, partial [Candidatus Methylomirabilis sp.]|nr:S41 family peptidase [Candidatus Methylomirabilis sp.]